ncbi:MAG: sugar ABC transporter permease [Myxococcaceae bacterium]|nr:sugar ABC transporter permease [Myxococcaceae bacterium]
MIERWRRGELGALPVVLGLVVVAVVFQSLNPNFLSPRNLTNLGLQIAAMATLSCGLVLVLLLGEIDLSAGAVSGLAAAVMAVSGLEGPLGLGAALLTGAAVGLFQGGWITRLAVPSFVVTLAGLLAWQGAQLAVLGPTGSLNLTDPFITSLCSTFLPAWAALAVAAPVLVLAKGPWRAALLLLTVGVAALFAFDRGLPLALLIVIGVITCTDLLVRRTRFGRHLVATGGNLEAARRAGIDVGRVRVTVFVIASTLAALGGVLAASRLLAVNQSSGSGDLLLNAIAAAVIGGTSLFGGRGSVWSALSGSLAIGAISNGMDLLGLASPVKFVVTGGVLLLAVTVDSLARLRRRAR